jgi:hypothetical protein
MLGPYDVLCGQCKTAYHNTGNRRFRITMLDMNLDAYLKCRSKAERLVLIASIVRTLAEEVGARFLKPQKAGGFVELADIQAREKVSRALRDMAVAKRQTPITDTQAWVQYNCNCNILQ